MRPCQGDWLSSLIRGLHSASMLTDSDLDLLKLFRVIYDHYASISTL